MIQGIYKITNKINNKIYIGSSDNVTYRWEQHINDLLNNKHHNLDLQNDFLQLYMGVTDLKFEILQICDNIVKEQLFELEGEYIYNNQSYKYNIGYNKIINNFKEYIHLKDEEKIFRDDNLTEIFNFKNNLSLDKYNKIKDNIKIVPITIMPKFRNDKNRFINEEGFLSKNWIRNNKDKYSVLKNMMYGYFKNYCKSKNKYWTTYISYKNIFFTDGTVKRYLYMNNETPKTADNYAFVANIYLNTMLDNITLTKENNNQYALSFLLKWIINNIDLDTKSELFIPSLRMYNLLNNYLNIKGE